MLSTLVVSALLVLQSGFAVADSTTGSSGRKSFLPPALQPRHRLLVRQDSTCPAGAFLCDNGVGCCDTGTTCGYSDINNAPICNGGTCNGGPICLFGLCCHLGYVCDEVAKLCTQDTSGGGVSSSSFAEPTSVVSNVHTSTVQGSPATLTSAPFFSPVPSGSGGESSSSDSNFDVTTSSFQPTATTQTSGSIPTSGSGFDGSNSQPTTVLSTLNTHIPVVTSNDASDLSANSGVKVFAGAVAGVLAFVL